MSEENPKVRIVGIGASAGGIEVLKDFFQQMPDDSGLAFVVVQHLDPNHESLMAELLSKYTKMKVLAERDQMTVEPDRVYTLPPKKFMFVEDGVLHLTDRFTNQGARMPIDFFFRSLASDQEELAMVVLLSGGGSDGTLGIREVHGVGGLVIVQEPASARFDSMIESAIATGFVDYVLPIDDIPQTLVKYAQKVSSVPINEASAPQEIAHNIDSILELLANEANSDFRSYKKSTVRRRIERRMGINHVFSMPEYHRLLGGNHDELQKLATDMLIGVTSFFRDPEAFKELLDTVIGPLVQENGPKQPIRVWVPGCATGEEAYSIVILFLEEMARTKKNTILQVYATDIDHRALKRARDGVFPESISADVSEERLARFFLKKDSIYQVDRKVRDCVTFAEQNLVLDPPFMRMDLVSCRNLLIYIEPAAQDKILTKLAFAVKPGGYLFLGKSDTPVERSSFFETISRIWRIFRRQLASIIPHPRFPTGVVTRQIRYDEPQSRELGELNRQILLEHFNAAIVIVSNQGEILHFYGSTEKYLRHPLGDASLSLFDMIEPRHSVLLRLAIERASRENKETKVQLSDFNRDDGKEQIQITISPVAEPRSATRLLAVIFEAAPQPLTEAPPPAPLIDQKDIDVFTQTKSENERLKHDLQSAIESFQVTHEEFTASNEEVLSINEELQSTNEELETSKEELQSLNEELITVNSQLGDKVEELSNANDDLSNLVNTSQVGTLILDRACSIRRFTPSMTRILNLLEVDVGRPVSHIATRMIDVDLAAIGEKVLKNLSAFEREVMSTDGTWYMLSCVPYRTQKNVVDGVVFNFTDVTRLKRSEQAMSQARTFAENIIETVSESLLVLDSELRIVSANRAFYRTFQVAAEDVKGSLIYDLGNGQWNIPRLRDLLEEVLSRDGTFENYEVEHEFPVIGRKIMSLNGRKLSGNDDAQAGLILLAVDDITERRQSEAQRNWLQGELRQAQKMESLGTLAAGIAHDFNNILNIVQGYAFVLRDSKIADELVTESVSAILDSTKRGATIVQQLLTLARKTEPKLELVKIDGVVEELAQLFGKSSPQTIDIKLELSRQSPPVMADRNQVFQALLNLCLNARDAMPDGGTLIMKTSLVNRDAVPSSEDITAERYVRVDVSDTGEGIDERILSRIFEPFFTTKGAGRGTGLGLAVVYGILKHHKGFIQVTSKPGAGTSFQIYLPVTRASD